MEDDLIFSERVNRFPFDQNELQRAMRDANRRANRSELALSLLISVFAFALGFVGYLLFK